MAPTATSEPPSIPPRPSRSQEKDAGPKVPPRPINRRIDRSVSPNPARFAPSPLNEGLYAPKSPTLQHLTPGGYSSGNHKRQQSVEIPSNAGEEGREYESLAEQMSSAYSDMSSSPEQTRTVGDDVKIHAPKPSLPAQSAKQRVMTVTRTDSDKAASFGIGKPSSDDHTPSSNRSLKKKASTISQLSTTESHGDDEHGIPEIGQQVPMFPNAGDVQAPSPAPGSSGFIETKDKNHKRRTSSRGNLPPGSYGLHGHGLQPLDKLEKQYFQKHPDLLKREHTPLYYDRPNDFSMSSDDLNKIVRETASHGAGIAVKNYAGTPSDQIGWQAIEESTSRVTSPRPEGNVIHVDDPGRRRSVMFSDEETPAEEEDEPVYTAPILAEDEILKGATSDTGPAVEPRRGSAFDEESAFGHPSSRPTSRPGSLYKVESHEHQSTPLEDVEEYEPLFPEEEGKEAAKKPAPESKLRPQNHKQRFPSRDIWEDAPDSVHYTVEVSTPDIPEEKEAEQEDKSVTSRIPVPRDGETPAQAFARHQEELAEQEARKNGPDTFLKNGRNKPSWAQHQLASDTARPSIGQRFPSRDVWEDTPDSHMLETTVSTPQQDRELESPAAETSKPLVPERPRPVRKPTDPSAADKPSVPDRPKPKSASADDTAAPATRQPSLPDRPKPQVPARPVKASPTSGGLEPAEAAAPPKQKPAVPLKSVGSKIAALQGSFLNDLNKKLGLGPQAPKKEEPAAEEEEKAVEDKAPLADARKSRARGPQRRAPAAKSPAPSAEEGKFSLGFAVPSTIFEIDPEEDDTVKLGHADAVAAPAEVETRKEKDEQPQEAAPSGASAPEEKPVIATEEDKASEPSEPVKEETKSLVNNSAGETILAEDIKVDEDKQEVQPTGTEE
ncbi:hypothetical protein CONLIGDRAFT_690756 [Coniochaeta ligniaria NRRL 30616]|uniref:Altered inheritance of mitochondria protein 21 n=1 Tax=Coniochaeta ligniaria NRRL 30616 TaxID=1408157 RepID=A0A1J7JBS7_9PEZI|nr:hypothetical protein CONLIGDRAFT_690756 [Coniochaeta ligniaria NRRL 30616]